jgi:hypothetical protein
VIFVKINFFQDFFIALDATLSNAVNATIINKFFSLKIEIDINGYQLIYVNI